MMRRYLLSFGLAALAAGCGNYTMPPGEPTPSSVASPASPRVGTESSPAAMVQEEAENAEVDEVDEVRAGTSNAGPSQNNRVLERDRDNHFLDSGPSDANR
jgi:hypothetical protein